jgi:hypothetical protein
MRRSIDFSLDDHVEDEDRAQAAWSVTVHDDCQGCHDLRIEVLIEDMGDAGAGHSAHLSVDTARRVRAALASALRELGADPGP